MGQGQEGCGNEESLCLCNKENDADGFRKALMGVEMKSLGALYSSAEVQNEKNGNTAASLR